MTTAYESAYVRSLKDPEAFWAEAAEQCYWYRKRDKVLDDSNKPFYRWFAVGTPNTCYNALDLHVAEGRGDNVALIYDSPVVRDPSKGTGHRPLVADRDWLGHCGQLHGAARHAVKYGSPTKAVLGWD
ncbi:MAG: acetyl-coenzyme A synthetase N-terminal domain-containing protein [Desulfosarcinaceae bacterium]|nr:acetyl-coenzyme A synthetase N-terminal domain-containing protein [Desulfosarcinaceae bacterium]